MGKKLLLWAGSKSAVVIAILEKPPICGPVCIAYEPSFEETKSELLFLLNRARSSVG